MSSHHIRISIGRVRRWYFADIPVADIQILRRPIRSLTHSQKYFPL